MAVSPAGAPVSAREGPASGGVGPKGVPDLSPDPLFEHSVVFQMALRQLQTVAEHFEIESGVLERLSKPKRALIVSCPIRMDKGHTENFIGFRVQHSLTSGPAKGGLRFHPNVDLGEVAALAMWMSWKCGIMNLPFGGGKGGIACDPATLSRGERERLTRRYTEEVGVIIGPRQDVMAPDMGTDEQTMAWIMDTYSARVGYACPEIVTGKPVELGGCVGRREATGRGVVYCVVEALKELKIAPESATAVVQGFGNVGSVAAAELHSRGVKVIAVSDRYGAIRNDKGLDIPALNKYMSEAPPESHPMLTNFPGAEACDPNELLTMKCTVLVPAALERVIDEKNAPKLQCRVIAEGANGPTTPDADKIIERSDIFVIPDVLCNAGGVTVSYFEWVQDIQQLMWSEELVNQKLRELMLRSFATVRGLAVDRKLPMRVAALSVGVKKVALEKDRRGLFP
ncbi:MAG: Glu/Leu/Phe/Val dehydrogenase [Gemmataceae bacterium]|nr:Glu/Leu/Phe/Val dehydrogenase [Gemmataceae bacterium]